MSPGSCAREQAQWSARTAGLGTVLVIQVKIDEGDQGLFYATSPNLHGLFVAAPSIDELYDEIPQVIKVLIEGRRD